jgi:predicted ABC-type transport system involved in lysophospholipase L1 biosynthesis ATPase subunit
MVMVTHDPTIAQRAGRILQMMDGRIISDQSLGANSSIGS